MASAIEEKKRIVDEIIRLAKATPNILGYLMEHSALKGLDDDNDDDKWIEAVKAELHSDDNSNIIELVQAFIYSKMTQFAFARVLGALDYDEPQDRTAVIEILE